MSSFPNNTTDFFNSLRQHHSEPRSIDEDYFFLNQSGLYDPDDEALE